MSDEPLISVLIDLQKETRDDQRRYHDEQRAFHDKQNATNEKVAAALMKVATEIEASNKGLAETKEDMDSHKLRIEAMEPVVARSKKSQDLVDNIITKVLAAIVLAVIMFFGAAGIVKVINQEQQVKQEQKQNGN